MSRRQAVALPAAVLAAAAATATTASPALAAAPPPLECEGELLTAASGLQFCEAVVGTGREPTKGTTIKAHYTGRLTTTGAVFDSSYTRGSPLQFKIGVGQVIRCETLPSYISLCCWGGGYVIIFWQTFGKLSKWTGYCINLSFSTRTAFVLSCRGWDEGILGGEGIPPMKVGGKRVLVIPANLVGAVYKLKSVDTHSLKPPGFISLEPKK